MADGNEPFSEVLKLYMENSGYTPYRLSQVSGINRTTIQRAITGKRLPQKEAVFKLAECMNLLAEETYRLMDSYELETEGLYTFRRRKAVKKMMEQVACNLWGTSSGPFEPGQKSPEIYENRGGGVTGPAGRMMNRLFIPRPCFAEKASFYACFKLF